jgi:protein-disulfide isomerase
MLFIHPDARLAHQAAMAAAAQGQFWPMHDLLFANRDHVNRGDLVGYASKLGLDVKRFETDLDSERVGQQIDADIAEGNRSGVDATPSYTINGRHFSGTRSFDQLKELIVKEQFRAVAMAEVTDEAVSKGPAAASLTLDLYMDLQSPVSRSTLDVVEQFVARYPSVRIRFRNFPLAFHPKAALAHEAAMAAARYGRFWELAR